MPMTRAQFAKQLNDGLNANFGMEYDEFPTEFDQFMKVQSSQKAFEEQALLVGLGYAVEKSEGGGYAEDAGQEGWVKRYTHREVALSFRITQPAIEDQRYMDIGKTYSRSLARSLRETREVYSANVLNNGFDTDYTGGDGQPLFSASHPTYSAGTQSNLISGGADLDEDSLEQILIQIRNAKDDRGIPVMMRPMKLVVSTSDEYNAIRLLQSTLRPGTADNDPNAVRSKGVFGQMPVVVTNLTDTDAWFVTTDIMHGLQSFNRIKRTKPRATVDNDTGNIIYRARERYIEGWSNWRGCYGSAGA